HNHISTAHKLTDHVRYTSPPRPKSSGIDEDDNAGRVANVCLREVIEGIDSRYQEDDKDLVDEISGEGKEDRC
ncbi:hypothetical protein RUND412_008370, partial [Rhizina undulata]